MSLARVHPLVQALLAAWDAPAATVPGRAHENAYSKDVTETSST